MVPAKFGLAADANSTNRMRCGLKLVMMANASDQSAAGPLPTPAERPESDVVIYDGHCRICTAQVRKLPWWDCQKKLSYLSLHDAEVARRWPDLPFDRMMQEMVIVDHTAGVTGGRRRFAICRAGCDACGGRRRFCISREACSVATAVPMDGPQSLPPQRRAKCDEGTVRCTAG